MQMARAILVGLLVIGFCGCSKPVSKDQQAAALMREANQLLAQSSSTEQWTREYGKTFSPQNRAQFPANREWLQAQADSIVKHLNEEQRLSNEAIAKYEQATGLMTNEQQRRGTAAILSALKKSVQVTDLMKAQVQLVSDDKIVDEKTFNARFMQFFEQIGELRHEQQKQFDEGKRLLGM